MCRIDLSDFVNKIAEKLNMEISECRLAFSDFMQDNDYFDKLTEWTEDKLTITDGDALWLEEKAITYLLHKNRSEEEKADILMELWNRKFPDTRKKYIKFQKEFHIQAENTYYLLDFFLTFQEKDLCLMDDNEVSQLVETAYTNLTKSHGDIFTFFLSYLKDSYKTRYLNDYVMLHRSDGQNTVQAYDSDQYLELVYYLFNEEYILDNDMYLKAAESKNYADTWLFLSMHFICALRYTDLARIYHPKLTMPPEEVIEQVKNDTFSEKDARLTLLSVIWRLSSLPLQPSKTEGTSGVGSIKLCVPESIEAHMGTLFALCEAHRLLNKVPDEEPLIRKISDYDRIVRYMGDDIGFLFLEANFSARSANKSFLQSIYMFTDDILETEENGVYAKGYILAALARSHKGSYGEFSHTTSVYLKDCNLSGLTPEFVAGELFERGVLSFIPSILLKMMFGEKYNVLPVKKQTKLLQALDLTPREVEQAVSITEKSKQDAVEIVNRILTEEENRKDTILSILHEIGSGAAVSKQEECLCLMTAIHRFCPYSDRRQCIGCDYEISTKSTIFLLISEYNRMMHLYSTAQEKRTKIKYNKMLKMEILPALDEILQCIREGYGEKALAVFEEIIKENTL